MVRRYCSAHPFENSYLHNTGRLATGGAFHAYGILLHVREPKSICVRKSRAAVGMIEKNRIVRRNGIERFFIRKLPIRISPSAPDQPTPFWQIPNIPDD